MSDSGPNFFDPNFDTAGFDFEAHQRQTRPVDYQQGRDAARKALEAAGITDPASAPQSQVVEVLIAAVDACGKLEPEAIPATTLGVMDEMHDQGLPKIEVSE